MRIRTHRVLPLFLVAFLVLIGGPNAALTPLAARDAGSAPAAAPHTGTLSGQMRDAATLAGIRGRLVFLTSPVPVNPVDTDANGNYSVVLDDGDYYIRFESGRCLVPVYRSVTIAGSGQTLNVNLNRGLDTEGYGYSCDDSIAMNWITGTTGQLFNDQQVGVHLPFAFNYYGVPVTNTTVWVTPAGYVTLGQQFPTIYDTHVQIPDSNPPNNVVYVYWDQFVTSTRGGVYTTTVGTAPNRKFVIEWRDMVLFNDDPQTPDPLNFELIFYEGGSGGGPGTLMDWQYLATGNNVAGQGRFATLGMENTFGTGALRYLFDNASLANNTAVHIYQPPIGTLSGRVTDKYSHQPLRARVCGSGTDLCKDTDPVTGNYTVRLIEAPYNVQVTASRHVTETRQVTITRNQTTTADFELDSAHVIYNPSPVNVAFAANSVNTATLLLDNQGAGNLQYRLREALGPEPVGCGSFAAAPEGTYIIDEQRTVPRAADNSTQSGETDLVGHYRYVVKNPTLDPSSAPPANILLFADDNFHGTTITSTYPAQALALLGWSYTGFYNDPTGFTNALNSPPSGGWNLVIVANDRNSTLQNNFEALRAYMDSSPNARMVFQSYKYNTTQNTTLFDRLGISQPITDIRSLAIPQDVSPWEPTEFIFNCPIVLTSTVNMIAPPFPGYQDYGDRLTANSIGLEWAGYTIDPTDEQAGIVARDDGRSVAAGFIVSTLTLDGNNNSRADGIDLFENLIKYVGNPPIPWGDITWLGETPTNGAVGAHTPFSATLTFTTTGLSPGTYTGYLFGLSNDPNAVRRQIQVNLTVCPGPCAGADLAVTDVTLRGYTTGRPVVGVPNQVAVTVKNVGFSAITFPNNYLYIDLYVDPNPEPPTSSTSTPYYGVVPGQTLQAGQSVVVNITWTPATAGDHRLWAWVNRECLPQVGEPDCTGSNQDNNNLAGPISGCVFTTNDYTFTDNPTNATFFTYIEQLYCIGAISGYPCGGPGEPCNAPQNRPYFRVGNNATRGQFTKILSNALGWNDTPTTQTFEDVPPTQTFYLWVQRAAARGVIGGYPCGTNPNEPCVPPGNRPYFRWGNNITRAQIGKVVVAARGWITGTPTPVPTTAPYTFQDVPPNNTFYVYVEQAFAHNVITGYNCGTNPNEPCVAPDNRRYFRPNANATRGQLSKMIVISASQP